VPQTVGAGPIAVVAEAAASVPHARAGAHRVIFVDLARAIGVALMVEGHTLDALLASSYRAGPVFSAWVFQRGLTSCLFLLLAGFAFSVATARHWNSHVRLTRQSFARVRRFAFFVVLGYALHFPAAHYGELRTIGDLQWRSFLAVDVLQLIGVSLLLLQALVLVTRTPQAFTIAASALCALLAVATPWAWATDWQTQLPLPIAAYLSSATGSQFPVIPWSAYVMLGAALGQIYGRWGAANLAAFANRFLLGAGAAMMVAASVFGRLPVAPFGSSDFWSTSPNQFLLRAGCVLLFVGLIAHLSQLLSFLPHVFGALAQESLLVYFVHLCIVYGSVWNVGLYATIGPTLSLPAVALTVVALVASMMLLAAVWNWCKHAHPRMARIISIGTVAALGSALL
jgi:heparan-alpha-glucosaminide N-acetyltransferase-like protein